MTDKTTYRSLFIVVRYISFEDSLIYESANGLGVLTPPCFYSRYTSVFIQNLKIWAGRERLVK